MGHFERGAKITSQKLIEKTIFEKIKKVVDKQK